VGLAWRTALLIGSWAKRSSSCWILRRQSFFLWGKISRAKPLAWYDVIEAESGLVGLGMARKYLPDLILSDFRMPGGDGASLLRDIRHDPELQFSQFVMMSGRPDLLVPGKGIGDVVDAFLVTRPASRSC